MKNNVKIFAVLAMLFSFSCSNEEIVLPSTNQNQVVEADYDPINRILLDIDGGSTTIDQLTYENLESVLSQIDQRESNTANNIDITDEKLESILAQIDQTESNTANSRSSKSNQDYSTILYEYFKTRINSPENFSELTAYIADLDLLSHYVNVYSTYLLSWQRTHLFNSIAFHKGYIHAIGYHGDNFTSIGSMGDFADSDFDGYKVKVGSRIKNAWKNSHAFRCSVGVVGAALGTLGILAVDAVAFKSGNVYFMYSAILVSTVGGIALEQFVEHLCTSR